jgi:alanine racemase
MPRPIHAFIDPQAVAHNLARARDFAPASRVFAVIKANAYGHGIERVFPGLRGADGLALLDLDEAQRVRDLGWRGPVLLLEGVFEPRDLELCSRLSLWHVVHTQEQIEWLAAHKASSKGHAAHHVFLKLNSGMNRLGFKPEWYRAAHARLVALPQVDEVSLMTHFAHADAPLAMDTAHAQTHANANSVAATAWAMQAALAKPLALVRQATDGLAGATSFANSAATMRAGTLPQVGGDWVRSGIMTYGASPDPVQFKAAQWGLLPAMSLRSRLIATQSLQAGDSVGYGGTFTAAAPMRVGVAACGYADGYPRHAPTGTPVLVDGVRTRTLGRVSMDMIAIDITELGQAGVGSEVTLWGASTAGVALPIDEVAQAAGTVGYELMCALAPRVPVVVGPA